MPICKRCKRLKPVAEFNQKADGSHAVRCTYCSNQMSKYQSKYLRTAKGKAKMKRANASEAYVRSKAKHKRRNNGETNKNGREGEEDVCSIVDIVRIVVWWGFVWRI